jgi:hypothetical protein
MRELYWRLKYLFGWISASNGRIFLIHYSLHFRLMRYKRHKFGFEQSVIKGSLLEEHSIFSAVSPIQIRVLKLCNFCSEWFATFNVIHLCILYFGMICRAMHVQMLCTSNWRRAESNPFTGLDMPCFQEIKDPRFQDCRHMKVGSLSALRTVWLCSPGDIPSTHFWLEPKATDGQKD